MHYYYSQLWFSQFSPVEAQVQYLQLSAEIHSFVKSCWGKWYNPFPQVAQDMAVNQS